MFHNELCITFQQNYIILAEADIRQRQEEDIMRVSTVLSISKVAASILLRYYNWYKFTTCMSSTLMQMIHMMGSINAKYCLNISYYIAL